MTEQIDLRRSRSRGRSTLSNEFRIRDEVVGTSKNIETAPDVPIRPHRSLSRLSHPSTRTQDHQLLHQVLQNHNLRTSSPGPDVHRGITRTSSIRSLGDSRARSKNIPMVADDVLRPAMKRWNSIQYLAQDGHANSNSDPSNGDGNSKYLDPNSVSPLTVIKDQYDTRRPVSNYVASADNHYRDLESLSESPQLLQNAQTNATTPTQSITSKIYNKMVKLIHGEENEGLNTVPGKDQFRKSVKSTTSNDNSSKNVHYQSESDDDTEDDSQHQNTDTTPNIGSFTSPNVALNEGVMLEGSVLDDLNLESIMDEINDFQNNFVQKYNATTPQAETSNSSRTQQKILDYRDLYIQDDVIPRTSSYFSLNSSQTSSSSGVSYHTSRIQHETIMQQYNQVRLRFSNGTDFSLYSIDGQRIPKDSKNCLRTNVGPLGFLNRMKVIDGKEAQDSGWHKLKQVHSMPDSTAEPLSSVEAPSLVHKLWHEEMKSLFPNEPKTPVTPSFGSSQNSTHSQLNSHFSSRSNSRLNSGLNSQIQSADQSPIALSNKSSFDIRIPELVPRKRFN